MKPGKPPSCSCGRELGHRRGCALVARALERMANRTLEEREAAGIFPPNPYPRPKSLASRGAIL